MIQAPGINLNGIVAKDGVLLVANSTTGKLFRVDPATGAARKLDLGGADLSYPDGLELLGNTLYVVRPFDDRVTPVALKPGLTRGVVLGDLTAPSLDIPTTATVSAGRLWVVSMRYTTPPTPATPYWITQLPLGPRMQGERRRSDEHRRRTNRGVPRYSRRGFLKRAGAGAGAVALSGGVGAAMAPRAVAARSATVSTSPTTFGRIFPEPAAVCAGDRRGPQLRLRSSASWVVCRRQRPTPRGPDPVDYQPGAEPQQSRQPDPHTAGTTFLGQFIDHDVTFDPSSPLGVVAEPTATTNTRDTRLDLDTVFGGGPTVSPQLYSSSDRDKFRIESGGIFEDLPRNSNGTAIIADPRNDENLIISGLQAAFILLPQQCSRSGSASAVTKNGSPPSPCRFAR